MSEDFLRPSDDGDLTPPIDRASRPRREPVRMMAIGSHEGVMSIIYTLYAKDFARVDEWSDLQPEPNTGKLMSILTKFVSLD